MSIEVRSIAADSDAECELVAGRMRLTLEERVGVAEARKMYSMDWLRRRLAWHLDSAQCDGECLLAVRASGEVVGHTIVRVEADPDGEDFGYVSTIFVVPDARRQRVGSALQDAGEAWCINRGLRRVVTNTAADNLPLIRGLEERGYSIVLREKDMVQLSRALRPPR